MVGEQRHEASICEFYVLKLIIIIWFTPKIQTILAAFNFRSLLLLCTRKPFKPSPPSEVSAVCQPTTSCGLRPVTTNAVSLVYRSSQKSLYKLVRYSELCYSTKKKKNKKLYYFGAARSWDGLVQKHCDVLQYK